MIGISRTESALDPPWRPWLRRKIAWLLLIKFAALILLKMLFFSGDSRLAVTPERVHLLLAPSAMIREIERD